MSEIEKHRYQTYSESRKSFFYKIFQRIIVNARNEFFNLFVINTNYSNDKSIIDVGTTPSLEEEQNIFLEKTKKNTNIICFSNQDCRVLKKNTKILKVY